MPYIEIENLTKTFKSYKKDPGLLGAIKNIFYRDYQIKTAVDNFKLEVEKGEIIGLLGPNGAGKTTLMKMFTGIIVPSTGKLSIDGHHPYQRDQEFRKKIALVMGQKSQLWWDIPAMDSFLLLKSYYEVPEKRFQEKLKYMAHILDVEELLHVHVRKLSLGERMKMELMASLIHDPDVIFLDEPTIGLDLVAQENIREFIKNYHQEHKTTIILTSHYMADVQALCKRLVLIQKGKKTFDGSIESFEKVLGSDKRVSFQFKSPLDEKTRENFKAWSPHWNQDHTLVDLAIHEDELRKVSADILSQYQVVNFYTEKLPIESVMKSLMLNPELGQKP